jgi:PAS domain S-box-containing protein
MEQRLHFETLLADVCAQFVNVAPSELDSKIESAQRLICESLGVNHSSVWQVSEDNPDLLIMTHAYRDPKLKPLPTRPILNDYFPWARSRILNREIVSVPNTEKVPPEAAKDMESWLQYGVRSTLAFPLSAGGASVIGLLAFDSTKERDWQEPLQRRLQILAHVFAQALDRKKSEQKVQESENRFRLVADTAPVLIWMSGTDKLCTYFNKPWLDFTGRSIEEELENGWAAGVHPDDLQRCLDNYTQAFDRREKIRMEYRLRHHDGQYRWILDIGVPRFTQDRSFAGYIGIGVDITDRKLAEEARFRHAAVVESSDDAIASGTIDGIIVSWNKGAQKIYGYTEAEAVGKPITMLVPPELADEESKILETLKVGGRIEHFETVRVTKVGKRINVSLTISPIRDSNGRIVGCSGIARDITERKMAEDRLREYERAVEGSEEMIAVVDREYRYLIANRQFLKMRNMTREEVVGHHAYEVLNKDFFERVVKAKLDDCFQGKVVRYETTYSYPQLGERDILVSYFPIEGASGTDRVACIVHDISDRKRGEEALLAVNRRLIEAQEQERARIGRELHDDINQRIAMLALELEQLQQNPSEVEGRVQELRRSMAELSNDVQALSHDLHSSKLEYLGVVAGMRSWCKEFGERQKMEIDFRSDVSSALPPEIGLSLFRVIQEALHNAQKHSGVRRIEVQLAEQSNEVHLTVRDSGRGFDVEVAKQGKGLGLTSMRERVRLVNGTIDLESKQMGGTIIHVRVPLESDKSSQREAV